MLRNLAAMLLVLVGLAAGAACASEAAIRQGFEAKFPNSAVESVTRTPFAGIYEVVFNGQIAYTDEKLNFVFFGNLVDVRAGAERNLTRERSAQLAALTLRKSSDNAIKRVRGNGKRVLYTFEDPNCGYCRELQKEVMKLTDVTVYTFLWPILSPDSVEKSKAVWCSKDRAKAWDDIMSRGIVPQNSAKCDAPLEKNHELAQRFGIRGTPAIFLADGRQVGAGYVPASELDQALNSAASK
ncbi:MAG: DsbC family protein [Burkholderiales bacterium]